ncbi:MULTISPECIES: hypothetical protein [unclassified Streptomyces]|uniref:hypothetical protein n=1 Tax=unclassified Streptomyces TaxID=2593676 RepID=UPI00037EDF40|nr:MULTISPECIES: hypothetical protein [unclassified Streptomyces]MYT28287.1 hypothetical protein [Streptomyces sp. SID8354]
MNQVVAEVAAHCRNLDVTDWDKVIAGHDGLLPDDGVHLGPAGARVYAGIVAQALFALQGRGVWRWRDPLPLGRRASVAVCLELL